MAIVSRTPRPIDPRPSRAPGNTDDGRDTILRGPGNLPPLSSGSRHEPGTRDNRTGGEGMTDDRKARGDAFGRALVDPFTIYP